MPQPSTRKPVILLMGPTASGKSAASMALANRWPSEIINVDSATIYRHMDIGTAKPGPEERAAVVHHLLDIRDPAQTYSAAQFRADAVALINDVHARGKLPLLVGGTMLYFKSLQEGLAPLPQANAQLRAQLEDDAARLGWPAMHQRLQQLDPSTAARLAPNDSQRIQRALEVCLISGTPFSALLEAHPTGSQTAQDVSSFEFIEVSLEPSDRGRLHERIAQRFDAMLAAGFVDEVAHLFKRDDLYAELPSMRCVGYRQLWGYLEGRYSLVDARYQGIAATRQLAKRQITWLRARPQRAVVDCLHETAAQRVIDAITPSLDTFQGFA